MKKISILFLILLCNCTFLSAQQFSITGVVTDKKLKEPIIGASVIVKGTTNGTVTDLSLIHISKNQTFSREKTTLRILLEIQRHCIHTTRIMNIMKSLPACLLYTSRCV